jgi:hypothetical protein
MFVGIHAMLATMTQTPELELSEEEGKNFTTCAQNVMRHYSVTATQKTLDWVAFVGCCTMIYGPRVAAISFRKASEKAKPTQENSNVINFGPTNIHGFPAE